MADNSITPIRVAFSSPGAIRARADHAPAFPTVQLAHHALIAALAQETPHRILGNADRHDLEDRAGHLKTVLAAVAVYAKAIVADTAHLAPCGYVADETGYLTDAAGDICGALESAAEKMITDADEAAE
jgi:hypothetical protein